MAHSEEYPQILFTLMLALLSCDRLDPRSGSTFEKIAFNYKNVPLRTLRGLAGGILKNSRVRQSWTEYNC